jgi:hypothetical protein
MIAESIIVRMGLNSNDGRIFRNRGEAVLSQNGHFPTRMNYSNLYFLLHRKPPATAAAENRQLTTVVDRTGHRRLILHRAGMPLRRGFRLLAQIGAICIALLAAAVEVRAQVIQPLTEATSKDAKIYVTLGGSSLQSDLSVVSQDTTAHFLSLVQFDLSSVTLTSLQITGATLTLYSTGLGVSGIPTPPPGTVTISPILDDWKELAGDPGSAPLATYNNFFGTTPPLHFGSAVASQTVTGAGFVNWDITNLVKAWKDGSQQNYGVIIQLSSNGGDVGFADTDSTPGVAGSAPKLTIVPEPGSVLLAFTGVGMILFRRKRAMGR